MRYHLHHGKHRAYLSSFIKVSCGRLLPKTPWQYCGDSYFLLRFSLLKWFDAYTQWWLCSTSNLKSDGFIWKFRVFPIILKDLFNELDLTHFWVISCIAKIEDIFNFSTSLWISYKTFPSWPWRKSESAMSGLKFTSGDCGESISSERRHTSEVKLKQSAILEQ